MRMRLCVLTVCLLGAVLHAPAQAAQSDLLTLDTWRVHAGDNPAWKAPAFDDSSWEKSEAPMRGTTPFVQPGYHWYRTTVDLPAALRGRQLAIGMGPIDEVYEVFVEGVPVGVFGRWEPKPESPFSRNLTFPISPELARGAQMHIAVRRWQGGSSTNYVTFYAVNGSRHNHPPELGLPSAIEARTELYSASGFVRNLPACLSMVALLAAGCIAFVLYSARRARSEYLILGFYCAGLPISILVGSAIATSDTMQRRSLLPDLVLFLYVCSQTSAILFLSRICPRFRRWLEFGTAVDFLSRSLGVVAMATQSVTLDRVFWTIAFYPSLLFTVLAAVGLFLERKRGSTAIGLAILVRQFSEAWTAVFAGWFHLNNLRNIPVGPFFVDFRNICDVVMVTVILTVLYFRFRDEQTATLGLQQDMASARRMQEQLLSTFAENPVGFEVDAVYRPAKEVGGDFYKTELLEDGSLLIVVGDVSGKGLDAALLVAAVLGGLAIDLERRPCILLQNLNKAVLGRTGGGFITACCARLYRDGRLVVANAGHISPYLDGKELPVEAGLPLGILAGGHYSESQFQTCGACVTWLSDGVLEAQNSSGELMGFERMAALTVKPAAEIADAAQRWGQEDDITVLTVRRALV